MDAAYFCAILDSDLQTDAALHQIVIGALLYYTFAILPIPHIANAGILIDVNMQKSLVILQVPGKCGTISKIDNFCL